MLATTGLSPMHTTIDQARQLAERLDISYVVRGEDSLDKIRNRYGDDQILVVSAKGARLESKEHPPFFFHPNTAAFRIKRLERGDNDTMLSACRILPGDQVLDATLGMGADSIVFAHAVGEGGRVVGIESQRLLAVLVEDGLKHWRTAHDSLQQAMSRVEVICDHHLNVLRSLPDQSFDVVYFDPMFTVGVEASSGIAPLRQLAEMEQLSEWAVAEAIRVARKRVVLKEGQGGTLHVTYGFTPYRKREHQVIYSYRETGGGE